MEPGAVSCSSRAQSDQPSILIVCGVWPHVRGSREAANVVAHEITQHLAASRRYRVQFLVVNCGRIAVPAGGAQQDLDALAHSGVEFLRPVELPSYSPARGVATRLGAILRGCPDELLVGTGGHNAIAKALLEDRPDVVLTIWSEIGSNAASRLPARVRVTYAGNPDHKVLDARLDLESRATGFGTFKRLRNQARIAVTKAAHLAVMRRFDLMWNVAANDAADYARAGVNARYLQNMWPSGVTEGWEQARDQAEVLKPIRIVGNVGNLGATGNSYGLMTIGSQIVPALERRLGTGRFEIHLFGGGKPHPAAEPFLRNPHVKVRGFVEDIDSEILSAPIFLVANNGSRFKVGHTRFLHAWSLGSTVVAFRDSREAMPEIEDGRNAVLCDTSDAIAEAVAGLVADRERRRMLAREGVATLARFFEPRLVTNQIIADIEKLLSEKSGRKAS